MSVIGRLDGQVDEMLIKPLSQRRDDATDQPPVTESSRSETPRETEEQTIKHEKVRDQNVLPVWLL